MSQDLSEVMTAARAVMNGNPPPSDPKNLPDRDELQTQRQPATAIGAAAQAYCRIYPAHNKTVLDLDELAADPVPAQSLPPEIGAIVDEAAEIGGLDRNLMRAIAYIESSGDAKNVTGSYKGLFQLSTSEFQKIRRRQHL